VGLVIRRLPLPLSSHPGKQLSWWVDDRRTAVWGWSYGGFLSLSALTQVSSSAGLWEVRNCAGWSYAGFLAHSGLTQINNLAAAGQQPFGLVIHQLPLPFCSYPGKHLSSCWKTVWQVILALLALYCIGIHANNGSTYFSIFTYTLHCYVG
jgi:hypothetical protein